MISQKNITTNPSKTSSDNLNNETSISVNERNIVDENKASDLNLMTYKNAQRGINGQMIATSEGNVDTISDKQDSSNLSVSSNNIILESIATKSNQADAYLNQFKKNNSVSKNNTNSKWKVQFYLTPSNSYRTLEDDKARLFYTSNQADRQALSTNVNDIVKHKPAVGGEFGVSFLYGLTKNFYIKSGLQFNVRQYGVDAYRSNGSASFAYVQNNQLNTITLQAAYSTKQGNSETKLENQLYQISAPTGLQWDAVDGERLGFKCGSYYSANIYN